MSAYQSIKISLIDSPEGRLRDVDQDWAECLAGMFVETGQKTPIDVVASGKKFTLVAGAHRLTAAKLSKWKEIDARILEPEGDQAADDLRLHEILENLGRKDFNALERCEALHEMKRIYEAKHPETKHGGKRGNQHTGGEKRQVAIFAFCQNAAESTGLSDRSVRLAIQIFDGLSPATRELLKGTQIAEKQSELKALSDLNAAEQNNVLDLILCDEPKAGSVADAKTVLSGKRPVRDIDKRLYTVCDYLPKLPKASRIQVFQQHKKEIIDLVKKEGWLNE
ncbi:ParB N-terminal domain-containing protein [uncultured Roseibium sp.]|uniref:ParB/RepB/Spo0J family partition protein n=1 Tax=uncultured Roseibium sp. TaxID=1936171 RepID=UPI002638F978|nr:ParB N-terminal domain-containing protein [uncultured Roseibium sp.]